MEKILRCSDMHGIPCMSIIPAQAKIHSFFNVTANFFVAATNKTKCQIRLGVYKLLFII
jgi:hypothetical protein